MRKQFLNLALLAATAFIITPATGFAKDLGDGPWAKERFQVRLRAIDVIPDESSSVNIGGKIHADNAVVPEVDLTYFFTQNIAMEVIAATSKHDLKYNTTALGEAWVLPPTATLQYHFTPDNAFSPYIGAGLNYSVFYGEDAATGFSNLKVDNGVGVALQAGADYWVNENWALTLTLRNSG